MTNELAELAVEAVSEQFRDELELEYGAVGTLAQRVAGTARVAV